MNEQKKKILGQNKEIFYRSFNRSLREESILYTVCRFKEE